MKKSIVIAMAAALMLCACSGKPQTVLGGRFNPADAPETVHVRIPDAGVDTLVAVKDGKFRFATLIDSTCVGHVECAKGNLQFVPDGSVLAFVYSGAEPTVVSSKPDGATRRLAAFNDWNKRFTQDYRKLTSELQAATDLSDAEKEAKLDAKFEEYVQYNKQALVDNGNNIVGLSALRILSSVLEDDELSEVLSGIGPGLAGHPQVRRVKDALDSRKSTAEGHPFVDFTIEDSDGQRVSLSDYVGKGKYMLVDFWASWCGPCKAELPNIAALYKKYAGKDFDVLSVAVWDKPEDTKKAAKELGITWNQIINADRIPTDLYGIEGIPHIILFGPDGTILARDLRGQEMAQAVAKALGR